MQTALDTKPNTYLWNRVVFISADHNFVSYCKHAAKANALIVFSGFQLKILLLSIFRTDISSDLKSALAPLLNEMSVRTQTGLHLHPPSDQSLCALKSSLVPLYLNLI